VFIELAVVGGLATAGALAARAWAKRHGQRQAAQSTKEEGPELGVGDVLVERTSTSSHWLCGSVTLLEDGQPRLRLFRAEGSPRAEWVLEEPGNDREVWLLAPTDAVTEGRVPDELRVEGRTVSLRRRGQGLVQAHGEGLPSLTESAEYVWLGGAGGATVVVVDFQAGDRLALAGERMSRAHLDRLPGSQAEPG
jgi:hypothetical protein